MKMRKRIDRAWLPRRDAVRGPLGQHALADDDANIPDPLDVLAALAAGAAKSVARVPLRTTRACSIARSGR
jgi:hypothetical protein